MNNQETILPNLNNLNIPLSQDEQQFIEDTSKTILIDSENHSDGNKTLKNENNPYTLSMKIYEFEQEKKMFAFINNIKRLIRSSYEYKLWVRYIKETLQHNTCALSNESGYELTIEIHHHPISLQSVILSVLTSFMEEKKPFCTFDIAQVIMNIHYEMNIGVIPLMTSMHEKFHNGCLNLPIDLVIGNWETLLTMFSFSEEQLSVIDRYREFTTANCEFLSKSKLSKTISENVG